MALEPLEVDTDRLSAAGTNLAELAGQIPKIEPVAPGALSPGSDPLSAAIAAKIPSLEHPVVDELPKLTAEGKKLAANVKEAARRYQTTDDELGKRLGQHRFDGKTDRPGVVGRHGAAAGVSRSSAPGASSNAPHFRPNKVPLFQATDYTRTSPKSGGDQDGRNHGYDKRLGKGSKTHVEPNGATEKEWGHPTDTHEAWPDVPKKTGAFDGQHGTWEWHGPGSQGEAYGSQHNDGAAGRADVDAWGAKGEATWSRDLFDNPLQGSTSGEVGAHANADAAITNHGVSLGADAFAGAEAGGRAQYHLGPVDLSLGGAAQFGVGGDTHLDLGMQDGKFVFGGTLGLALGPGAKISPHIAIDPHAIVDGMKRAGGWISGLFH